MSNKAGTCSVCGQPIQKRADTAARFRGFSIEMVHRDCHNSTTVRAGFHLLGGRVINTPATTATALLLPLFTLLVLMTRGVGEWRPFFILSLIPLLLRVLCYVFVERRVPRA